MAGGRCLVSPAWFPLRPAEAGRGCAGECGPGPIARRWIVRRFPSTCVLAVLAVWKILARQGLALEAGSPGPGRSSAFASACFSAEWRAICVSPATGSRCVACMHATRTRHARGALVLRPGPNIGNGCHHCVHGPCSRASAQKTVQCTARPLRQRVQTRCGSRWRGILGCSHVRFRDGPQAWAMVFQKAGVS